MPLHGGEASSEAVFAALKELQQEKSCLENKLKNLRQKRAAHEARLDSVSNKYHQVRDINSKMAETLKVAQHKVTSTQARVKELEAINDKKRVHLDQINLEIAQEEQQQMTGRNQFEDHLAELINCFTEAKAFYNNMTLTQTMEGANTEMVDLQDQQSNMTGEETELVGKLQGLEIEIEEQKKASELLPIPVETQKLVQKLITTENQQAHHTLEAVNKVIMDIRGKIEQSQNRLKELKAQHSHAAENMDATKNV